MNLSFMQNEWVLALCWTLIHSLWQGFLLAMATGAIMIVTRKANAGKRYKLLTGLFFVFMMVTISTFIIEYQPVSHADGDRVVSLLNNSNLLDAGVVNHHTAVTISLLDRFKDYFNTHASLIVMIWFIIFIARFIKLTANVASIQRLRYYRTHTPSQQWINRMNELVAVLGLRTKIQLLESAVVKVPMVLGIFKPVILLPLGLLAHLPANEIEAILLHELAHIKRRDFLVNLLQNFAETIFFFNPALMWLSSVIRDERENCCDDIAIAVTNNKTNFINALIAFQEYNFSNTTYTVGFPGRKNQLLNRVTRIVNEKNKTLNATEKSLLTLGMGIFMLFSFAAAKKITPPVLTPVVVESQFTQPMNEPSEELKSEEGKIQVDKTARLEEPIISEDKEMYTPETHEYIDTVPSKTKPATGTGKSVYGSSDADKMDQSSLYENISVSRKNERKDVSVTARKKDGTEYSFKKVNGTLTELAIDGNPISQKDFSNYTATIEEIETVAKYREEKSLEKLALSREREAKMLNDKKNQLALRMKEQQDRRKFQVERDHVAESMKKATLDLKVKQDSIDNSKRSVDFKTKRDSAFNKKELTLKHKSEIRLKTKNYPDSIKWKKMESKNVSGKWKAEPFMKETVVYGDVAKFEGKDSARSYAHYGEVVKYTDLVKEGPVDKTSPRMKNSKEDKLSPKIKDNIQKEKTEKINDKLIRDSIKRVLDAKKQGALFNRKKDLIRTQLINDGIRRDATAARMRDIIKDLEKEGVKMDVKTGWFGLDGDKFVVDGKPMTRELHNKFIEKYINPNNGLGYFYGPVKVSGKGYFIDHNDLAR